MYIVIINWKNVKFNIIIFKIKFIGFLGFFLWSVFV